MKTKVIIFMLFGIAGLILTGCNNKKQYRPDANIVSAMNAKYPKATKIEWEKSTITRWLNIMKMELAPRLGLIKTVNG